MLNLDSQGDVVDTVLCTGHDLYGVPRDAEDHGAAADLPGDALPQAPKSLRVQERLFRFFGSAP